jgi:predicted AAA+ superfamily ATPase
MEAFFDIHANLVEHVNAPVRRALMDEIDWSSRMIGIKGTRGVGKTTFLLEYAKENFDAREHRCLYINMNNFYFQGRGIADFAGDFYRQGGRVLLIDQVFKHPNWSRELRRCYDEYPNLKIVFTGSSVMRLKEENPELNGIVSSYNLRGFSFREYLNWRTGNKFPIFSLEDMLEHHEELVRGVLSRTNPLFYFPEYLKHGFYPFFMEKRNFSENLVKTMNMMIEVDILLIKQIELKYLPKLKKLLYLLAMEGTGAPNVSQLADDVQTSRATVMNYIKYLADARLINMVYKVGESFPKKPMRILMHNPNLMYAFYPIPARTEDVLVSFFLNTLWKDHVLNVQRSGRKLTNTFLVDDQWKFKVSGWTTKSSRSADVFYAQDGIEMGHGKLMPLWLLGFLY